jgi:anti-sigma regulatory factor (Ser/Thr protein kinase)
MGGGAPNQWALTITLDTDSASIRAARKSIAALVQQVGGSLEEVLSVEVAIGEILANARVHAYAGGVGPVALKVHYDDGLLTVVVHDEGRPVTETVSIPARPPQGAGGRGLFLVSRLMDSVEVVPNAEGKGIAVRVGKRLKGYAGGLM